MANGPSIRLSGRADQMTTDYDTWKTSDNRPAQGEQPCEGWLGDPCPNCDGEGAWTPMDRVIRCTICDGSGKEEGSRAPCPALVFPGERCERCHTTAPEPDLDDDNPWEES